MVNPFDTILKSIVFEAVAEFYGGKAQWISSTPPFDGVRVASVTLKNPNLKEREAWLLDGFNYSPENIIMEYLITGKEPDIMQTFAGLYESVGSDGIEDVTIEGVEYNVQDVLKVSDGHTFYAKLLKR